MSMYGPIQGGVITNPQTAQDQGIALVEPLFIDVVFDATPYESQTTIPIQPGQSYEIPAGQTTNVSVNALTSGHRFSAFLWQPLAPPVPPVGPFPPLAPTTLTKVMPSYLYQEYSDDDDLQAFVAAYNALGQQYVTWFATIALPVYTGSQIVGTLLDWVANGLYGVKRPSMSSGRNLDLGPFNTARFNVLQFNGRKNIGPQDITDVSDDIFKRIITWNFYKGDGNVFTIRWLKRRIMRFLFGVNGTAPNIVNSDQVSVTFSGSNRVDIVLVIGVRTWTGGSRFNKSRWGQQLPFNQVLSSYKAIYPLPNAAILKEAIENGVLQLPFQFSYFVTI